MLYGQCGVAAESQRRQAAVIRPSSIADDDDNITGTLLHVHIRASSILHIAVAAAGFRAAVRLVWFSLSLVGGGVLVSLPR